MKQHKVVALRAQTPLDITVSDARKCIAGLSVPALFPQMSLPLHVDQRDRKSIEMMSTVPNKNENRSHFSDWAAEPLVLGQNECEVGREQSSVVVPSFVAADVLLGLTAEMLAIPGISQEQMCCVLPILQALTMQMDSVRGTIYPNTPTGDLMNFQDLICTYVHRSLDSSRAQLCQAMNDAVYRETRDFAVRMDWNTPRNRKGAILLIDNGEEGETDKFLVHGRDNGGTVLDTTKTMVFQGTLKS